MEILIERDGRLYIRDVTWLSFLENMKITTFWLLDITREQFIALHGKEILARRLDQPVKYIDDGCYEQEGLRYRLEGGGNARPAIVEQIPIAHEPPSLHQSQRGSKRKRSWNK